MAKTTVFGRLLRPGQATTGLRAHPNHHADRRNPESESRAAGVKARIVRPFQLPQLLAEVSRLIQA